MEPVNTLPAASAELGEFFVQRRSDREVPSEHAFRYADRDAAIRIRQVGV